MSSSYPASLDSFTNPTATDQQNSPSHTEQHANANDAIAAIQGELGTDPAGSYSTVKDRFAAIDALLLELANRLFEDQLVKPEKISSSSDAIEFCKTHFHRLIMEALREEFHIVTLDTKNQVIATHQVEGLLVLI